MCNWCVQHGDGKKWYLNIKNYSKDLLKDETVVEAANRVLQYFDGKPSSEVTAILDLKSDEEFSQMVASTKEAIATYFPHRGQVVPIEEVKEILKLVGPIARISCICRRRGRANFDEKPCILLGPVYLEYAKEWPDSPKGGIHYISKEETGELMDRYNQKGYVATIWRDYESPAIVGFCNCEFPTCGALSARRHYGDGFNFFIRKAEYVAVHDPDKCTGCRECVARCQFGAISYSPYFEKAILNMKKCAGCGLCRDTCAQKAIKLVPRVEVPAVSELW